MIAEKRKLFFFILIAGLHSPYQSGVQTVMPCFADQWTAVGRWRCIPMGTVVFRNRMRCVCTPCPPPSPPSPPLLVLHSFVNMYHSLCCNKSTMHIVRLTVHCKCERYAASGFAIHGSTLKRMTWHAVLSLVEQMASSPAVLIPCC